MKSAASSAAPSVVRSVSVGGAASSSGGLLESDVVRWFLGLTSAERSYALALEDKATVKLALSLYHQRAVKGDGYFFDLNADSPPARRSSASLSPTNAANANANADNALHAMQAMGRAKDDSTAKVLRRGRGRSNSSSTPLSASLSPAAFTSSASASSLHSLPLSPQSAPTSPSYGFRGADKLHTMFHSTATKQAAEQRLESALRLCDTRQYCDTMLLSAELCGERDGKEVLELLSTLSAGRFLSQPCATVELAAPAAGKGKRGSGGGSSGSGSGSGSGGSSSGGSTALSESPAWFKSLGFFSFAVWVASRMEVALWTRYREAKASERGERRSSTALTNLVRERLSSKAPLQQFWQSLSADRRDKVWQKLTAMVEAVRRRDDTDDSKSNASSTSFSTTHEQDLADWGDEEKLQLSPSVVVSPLSGSSSMSLSMSRSGSMHRTDINSAPIAAARSRGRSVSPPPSRRKPSLPTSSSASHAPSTLSFPMSPPFRAQPRQISIPSSTASASSATSSPARSLSPSSSSSSSLPSRSHTPPPHPQRGRSSSALSASSTLSCPSTHSKPSSTTRRTTKHRKPDRRPSSARQRGKGGSWDGAAGPLAGELVWDDSGSVRSESSIIVRDAHDYQRGVDQLLVLIKCMQAESRAAAGRGRDRKRSVRVVEDRVDERKEAEGQETLSASCLTPSPLHRACSQANPSSATQQAAAESPALLSVSQPLPPSPSTSGTSSGSAALLFTPTTPSSANSLTPLFLSSAALSKPTSPALSPSSSAAHNYPSLTLTLAELQSSLPSTIPLPPPHSLSSADLIDFIFLSPLPRAHTSLDLIVRRMGVVLGGVYAESMGMELIVGEDEAGEREEGREEEREKARKRKAKKKKQQQKMRRRTKDDTVGGHKKETDRIEHNSDEVDDDATDTDTQPVKVKAEAETAASLEENASVEKTAVPAADEEDETEVKGHLDAESSEHSSSSGDEDRGRQQEWTEVIREERRKEEKRRLRKRMQAAARAKDDFYFSSSSSSLLSSTSPSLSSRPSHSSFHSVNGLPPRSPMRAKDDAFYSDRAARPSSYSFTSLPLSRGVSIQAGSPSPSTWAKVAYQSGAKTSGNATVWSNGQSASTGGSALSAASSNSAPSSPLVLPQTALSHVPAPHMQRSTSSGAASTMDTSPLPSPSSSSISLAASLAGTSTPALSPLTLTGQKQPSLSISPDKLASLSTSPTSLVSTTTPSFSVSQLSPSVAAYVQSFTSSFGTAANGTAASSPQSGKKLSTAELIAFHEDKVKAAATPKAVTDGLTVQLPFSASSRMPPQSATRQQPQFSDRRAIEAERRTDLNVSPPPPTLLLSSSPPVPRPSPPPAIPLQVELSPSYMPPAGRPFAGVFPSGEEMRAAIAQAAAAHGQAGVGPALSPTSGGAGKAGLSFSSFRPEDIPVSTWQRAQQFWQEQAALMERQQQQQQAVAQHLRQRQQQQQQQQHNPALQPQPQPQQQSSQQPQQQHQRMSRSSSFSSTHSDTSPSHNPPPPAPAPQLRTYIRGPIMSLSSLPPQYRRDSSASSSASSSSGVASPSFSERHGSQHQMSVAAMIRAYERARQIESVNVARGWDKQRPAVVVGYGQYSSQHTSSSSSPSSLSPLPDYAQPHSAPLVPPHLAAAHYSPLLIDQPMRSTRSPHRLSHGSYDEQRMGSLSSFTSQPGQMTNGDQRASLVCPPWLNPQTVLLFSLSASSASSCSYCAEIAEKAKAGAIAPGRPRDLSLQSDPSEMTPQQQTLLLARSNGVGAIMAAQQTAKPAILPNFIVTPAIYKRGHPLAPLPPSQSLQQLRESTTPQSPHRLLHHHHHHHHQHGEGGVPEPLRLHREIELFTAHVTRLAVHRHPLLSVLLHRMRDCVLSLWPGCSVHSYGSFMTGLSLPSSDLDIVLLNVPLEGKQAMLMLATLLKSQHSWVVSLNAIDTARVPVIKVTARVDGQQVVVDITFDQATDTTAEYQPGAPFLVPHFPPSSPVSPPAVHSGVASVDLLCHYIAIFPALRPLCLILKQFLYERGLASTYTGGLNSYCLVLMLVAYLQSRPHPYRYYRQHMQQVHERLQIPLRANTPLKSPPAPLELPATPPLQPRLLSGPTLPATPPNHLLPSGPSSPAPKAEGGWLGGEGAGGEDELLSVLYGGLQGWEDDLGGLLVGVLEWYGEVFDFSCMGIAVAPPPTMPYLPSHLSSQLTHISMREVLDAYHGLPSSTAQSRAETADDGVAGCFFRLAVPSSLLVLSDPFYPPLTNNIGKSVFGMLRVKAAFEEGLQQLRGQTRSQHQYTPLSRMLQGPAGGATAIAGLQQVS